MLRRLYFDYKSLIDEKLVQLYYLPPTDRRRKRGDDESDSDNQEKLITDTITEPPRTSRMTRMYIIFAFQLMFRAWMQALIPTSTSVPNEFSDPVLQEMMRTTDLRRCYNP